MVVVDFKKEKPENVLEIKSAWEGLESVLKDILKTFNVKDNKALEFGVEFGYSTVAIANYFKEVVGVDTFKGDMHAGYGESYDIAKKNCDPYKNIQLVQSDYKDFIKDNNDTYDFIHVDIVHNYKDTFECGLWAAEHAPVVIFHDTESFPEVKRAVEDIAFTADKVFYNYPHHYGLGIIAHENTSI